MRSIVSIRRITLRTTWTKIERPAPQIFFTDTKMLTRAMTKDIKAKAEYIKEFHDKHEWVRKQPDRAYERIIKWFRKHNIELPAGACERTEEEFLAIFMPWLGLSHLMTETFKCYECDGSYNVMDKCYDGRCIPCTNKERRQQHKRQLCPYMYRTYE